jgi:hypothetical protein
MAISSRVEACRRLDDVARYHQLLESGDLTAAFTFGGEHCELIPEQTDVMVDDYSLEHRAYCVRPKGQTECVWADNLAVWKSFDQTHPECKAYKTDKTLPGYCY